MSSTESFDELEQKITSQFEEALGEVREEFLARLDSTREQLEGVVNSEMATAREQAESKASADFEEAKAAFMAEAEKAREAAIAEALEAKEAEFAEILAGKDAAIAEIEEAKAAFMAEAEEAREAVMADAEEAKTTAIAEALEAKESEFSEMLAATEAAFGEAEEAKTAFMAEAEEAKAAAIAEALEVKGNEFGESLAAKESALADLEQAKEAALTDAQDAKEATISTLHNLHQTIARIDAAQTQTQALEAFLGGTAGFASRSMLFLTREDGLQGWGGQGFDTEQGRLQEAHFDYDEGTAWSELAEGRGTIELSDEACEVLCNIVDGSKPLEGVLIPLVLRDRIAAALYADRLEDQDRFHLLTLQLLAYVTGQALETLPLRTRSATATLRLVTEAPADEPGLELWQFLAPAEPLVEDFPTDLVEEPVHVPAEPEEMEAEEAIVEPTKVPEPEPVDYTAAEDTGFEVEEAKEVEAREPEPVEAAEMEAPSIEVEPPTEVAPPPTEVAPPPTEVTPPSTEVAPPVAAGAEVAPPEDVDGPGWAFTTRRFDSESGEDATHEEARRLARLLVTEIKLYNEEQVEEGRRGRNIYRTLKEDIDRSRQIYEERVDEAVRADTDYFRDELVKILAAGDDDVMGA